MNLSFIKLDINIMNDTKIKIIRKMPDGDKMIVLWVGILCLGMKSGKAGVLEIGDGIPFTDETLSAELDIPVNTIRLGLKTFEGLKMIEFFSNQSIYITNFEKHQELDKIEIGKEKLRLRVKKSRDKKKQLLLCNDDVTVTGVTCNAIDKDIDKETDKEKDIDKKNKKASKEAKAPTRNNPIIKYIIDRIWSYLDSNKRLPSFKSQRAKLYHSAYTIIDTLCKKDNPVWVVASFCWATNNEWWKDKATYSNLETIGNQFNEAKDQKEYLDIYKKELTDEFGIETITAFNA